MTTTAPEVCSDEAREWNNVGAELREIDPVLYFEMLELAERVVMAHRDPRRHERGRGLIGLQQGTPRGEA